MAIVAIEVTVAGVALVLALVIAVVKGITLSQLAWVLGDVLHDPLKWLRPRDEHGHLRPARHDGQNGG